MKRKFYKNKNEEKEIFRESLNYLFKKRRSYGFFPVVVIVVVVSIGSSGTEMIVKNR